jgi:Holliday junction resolvasome RuvABC endonuclease subunit
VAQMVKLLLGLDAIPRPHDATDALAVAICHLHNGVAVKKSHSGLKSWRQYRP